MLGFIHEVTVQNFLFSLGHQISNLLAPMDLADLYVPGQGQWYG